MLTWKKCPFLHFNTVLLSRHAFFKNGMQCSKLQSLSHKILNFVLKKQGIDRLFPLVNAMKESDYIVYRYFIYRGSYMSAHVLLNLLNELGEKIRCEALPSILSVFSNEFNKFNNTGARMQDSNYHMTLNRIFFANSASKHRGFAIRKRDFFMEVLRRHLHL